jgi:hypothetical protein
MFVLSSSLQHALIMCQDGLLSLTICNNINMYFAGLCSMDNTSVGDQGLLSEGEFHGLGSSLTTRLNHLFHLVSLTAMNGSQTCESSPL